MEAQMSNVVLMAWSSPASPELEAEFNSWYDGVHIPQVSKLLGVTAKVQRYRVADRDSGARYVAIYQLGDHLDVPAAGALLGGAVESGRIDMTAAMDVGTNPPELMWLEGQA
jgi:hypothetical protein